MKFRSLLSVIVIINLFFVTNSCSKENPLTNQAEIISPDFRMMHVVYYRESKDGSAIEVRCVESERIISLPKTTKDFSAIKSMLDESISKKTPVSLKLSLVNSIVEARDPGPHELSIFNNIWIHLNDTIYPEGINRTIISMDELNSIFDYMEAQGCATGTAEIDHCIPFQYVVDGCYARAHKMRQILLNKYHVSCEKVFSFEGPTGSLAVDAGDCCVFWWYHVAPLVTVSTVYGPKKYVMDPSMFDHPVTIDEWTTAQENISCTPWADCGSYDITEGVKFWPYGTMGPYGEDTEDYEWTNTYLDLYSTLSTCD